MSVPTFGKKELKSFIGAALVGSAITMVIFLGADYLQNNRITGQNILNTIFISLFTGSFIVYSFNRFPPNNLNSQYLDKTLKRCPVLLSSEIIQQKTPVAKSGIYARSGVLIVSNQRFMFLPHNPKKEVEIFQRGDFVKMHFRKQNKFRSKLLEMVLKSPTERNLFFWVKDEDRILFEKNIGGCIPD